MRIFGVPDVSRFPTRPRLASVLPGAALILALPLVAVRPISDPSPWLHLKVGEYLASGGRFAGSDPWAPMAAGDYQPTQWLPSIVVSVLVDQWGLAAVEWARGVGVLLFATLMLWSLARVCRPWLAVVLALVGLLASWPSLTERPQLLGFVLLVPVVGAWWQTGHDRRPRWWLIPFTWLAACTHGIWAIGVGVGGLVVIGLILGREVSVRSSARLFLLLAGCVAAAGITPLGPRLLLTPFTVGANGRDFVAEWMPSSIRTPSVALVMGVLAVAWLLWLVSQQRTPLWQLLLFCAAALMGLLMQRTVPVAAILAAFLCAGAYEVARGSRAGLVSVSPRPPRHHLVVSWALASLLSAVGITAATQARGAEVRGIPAAMEPILTSAPAGTRVLAFGDLTGWLMYAAPKLEPVFDLRIEQYEPQYVRRYIAAMEAEPGWDSFVSSTGSRMALLEADSPLTAALTEQLRWKVTARDAGFVLLEARP